MINNLTKTIRLTDLKKNRKYNLILKLQAGDVIMENLKSSEISQEVNALNINCTVLKRPFNYFITEYVPNSNQKTYKC